MFNKMKLILFLTIITTILLLMTPLIPAVEYSTVKDTQKQNIMSQIKKTHFFELFKHIDSSSIREIFQSIALDQTNTLDVSTLFQINQENPDEDIQPLFFPFLGIFIYGFIAYVILKIVFTIIKTIATFIGDIRDRIVNKIKTIFQNIINFISLILTTIATIISHLLSFLGNLGNLAINGVLYLINIIIKTITAVILSIGIIVLSVLYGIIFILASVWQIIENFFGLIFQIIDFIFNGKTVTM